MKKRNSLLLAALAAIFIISCEKDFNGIGENLIDQTNFNTSNISDVTVTTTQVNFYEPDGSGIDHPVQTDNLSYNLLGIYNDPVYGYTTANVVTQVELNAYGVDFDDTAQLTDVELVIPYYSRRTEVDAEGAGTYELDSVYGSTPIDLKVFRSNYFLNDFVAGDNDDFDETRRYYSDEQEDLFGTDISPINLLEEVYTGVFSPDNAEDFNYQLDEDGNIDLDDENNPIIAERFAPRFRESLDVADFAWLLDPANEVALSNANNFKDFYRGLYFTVALQTTPTVQTEGVLAGLDLSNAFIDMTYEYEKKDDDGNTELDEDGNPVMLEGTVRMTFTGKKVNFFNNTFNPLTTPNRLYLKGGEGAMAEVNLFGTEDTPGSEVYPELEALKTQAESEKWLINEANLQFYVDNNITQGGNSEPERIFLFDIDNNKVLLDYLFDSSTDSDANNVKVNHLGRIERNASDRGVVYKVNVTEHINSLIKLDSTNVKLGLMVSNNVSLLGSSDIKNTENAEGNSDAVLSSSVVSHRGTVLYDENAVDEDKKLKLNIYYTKED